MLVPSMGMKEESPDHGSVSEEVCGFCAVYFGHLEVWTPRNEALMESVVKQAIIIRHLWLVARRYVS